jgi:hypothetical protein
MASTSCRGALADCLAYGQTAPGTPRRSSLFHSCRKAFTSFRGEGPMGLVPLALDRLPAQRQHAADRASGARRARRPQPVEFHRGHLPQHEPPRIHVRVVGQVAADEPVYIPGSPRRIIGGEQEKPGILDADRG